MDAEKMEDPDTTGSAQYLASGVVTELGAIPSGSLVTEKGLAEMLGRSQDSIKGAVRRGELPAPVRMFGKPTWTAGAIVQHIERRLEEAARDAQRTIERISKYGP